MRLLAVLAMLLATRAARAEGDIPAAVMERLPAGYEILADTRGVISPGGARFYVVALARLDEDPSRRGGEAAPARPLLILRRTGARATIVARNDNVVMRADEGGQCDPFKESSEGLRWHGRGFTVENAVACGSHWMDSFTFRADAAGRFVFDREISQDWRFNPDRDPGAEALVTDGPSIVRGNRRRPVSFERFVPDYRTVRPVQRTALRPP